MLKCLLTCFFAFLLTLEIDNKKDDPPKDHKKTEFQKRRSFGGLLVVDERDRKKTRKRQGKDSVSKDGHTYMEFGVWAPALAWRNLNLLHRREDGTREIWQLPPAVAAVPAFGLYAFLFF